VISGSAKVGQELAVSNGSWEGSPPTRYEYQWETCNSSGAKCKSISGAIEPSYEPVSSQVSEKDTLRAIVTAVNSAGSASATSEATAVVTTGPPRNKALPAISGAAEEGVELTAGKGTWVGSEPIEYKFQWQSCNAEGKACTNIETATGEHFKLGSSNVGTTLAVVVTGKNSVGETSATSSTTAVVASKHPVNTVLPSISGTAQDRQVLSASTGTWTGGEPISYGYQWESCDRAGTECVPIEYATGLEYDLGDGNVGTTLRVIVTATNAAGATQATSPPTAEVRAEPPGEIVPPSISGTPDVHDVLYANPGVWAGTAAQLSYQWESCSPSGSDCAPVEGATSPEYDLAEGDAGSTLRVRIGAGSALAALTDVSAPTPVIGAAGALANTSAPTVSGFPQSGQVLDASPGTWSSTEAVSYAYQWQSCDRFGAHCEDIEGATSASYTPEAASVASTLRILVTASDPSQSLSQASLVTQPVASARAPVVEQPPLIAGPALQGDTLTASTGTWSGEGTISYSYQWQRCSQAGECTAIEHATASSYTLTEADVSSTIRVVVSATDAGGSSQGVSRATASVGPESLLKFSAPSISGVLQLGGSVTAEPGIWSGSGPVTYSYQWQSCNPSGSECAPIEGATEASYLVGSGDQGSTLQVKVTITSPLGSASALSVHTLVVPGGELSVEAAQEVAQQTDPALLAASTTTTLEEQTISPALADTGEEIASQSTLTSSSISKETPGELAVNTPSGELSLTPVESLPGATTNPTIVNGAAALFANTWPATDTIVAPSRSAQPRSCRYAPQKPRAPSPGKHAWAQTSSSSN
jgi:hypothetical protein